MAGLVAPAAGHAAAAGVELLDLESHLLEQRLLGVDAARGLVVAVAVEKRLPLQERRLPAVGVLGHELGEVLRLGAEPLRVLVVRPELDELVLEHGRAARLDPDHRRSRPDVVAEVPEHLAEVCLGEVEHPVVVERPAATEMP